jgi:hypothetical protein
MRTTTYSRGPRSIALIVVLAAFLGATFPTPSTAEPAAPPAPKAKSNVVHVYLLRGLFNVFSTGMDGIRDKLKQRNINATVHSHLVWSVLADEAVEDYRRGRVNKIIIIGHSLGATNAVDMANKIGSAGVPVSLVVALDPSLKPTVTSNNVRWVVDLYLPDGMYGFKVNKEAGYTGVVENVELRDDKVNHVSLDKVNSIQDWAIKYALKAIKEGPAATAMKLPVAPSVPTRAKSAKISATPAQ